MPSVIKVRAAYAKCRLWWVWLMLSVINLNAQCDYAEFRHAEGGLCWVWLMLSVINLNAQCDYAEFRHAECGLCWVWLMLSVTYAEGHSSECRMWLWWVRLMLSFVMLRVSLCWVYCANATVTNFTIVELKNRIIAQNRKHWIARVNGP